MGLLDQIESDLDTIFNPDDFGVSATWTPSGGDPVTVTVIFDKDYQILIGDVMSSGPAAHGKASAFPGVKNGDQLMVSDIIYSIIGVEPDGAGIVVLRLKKVYVPGGGGIGD